MHLLGSGDWKASRLLRVADSRYEKGCAAQFMIPPAQLDKAYCASTVCRLLFSRPVDSMNLRLAASRPRQALAVREPFRLLS